MGFAQQGWSAAMFLFAHRAVQTGRLPLFDELLAAKPEALKANESTEMYIQPGGGPI